MDERTGCQRGAQHDYSERSRPNDARWAFFVGRLGPGRLDGVRGWGLMQSYRGLA